MLKNILTPVPQLHPVGHGNVNSYDMSGALNVPAFPHLYTVLCEWQEGNIPRLAHWSQKEDERHMQQSHQPRSTGPRAHTAHLWAKYMPADMCNWAFHGWIIKIGYVHMMEDYTSAIWIHLTNIKLNRNQTQKSTVYGSNYVKFKSMKNLMDGIRILKCSNWKNHGNI